MLTRGSRLAWPAAIGALAALAIGLRVVGLKTGLPYVYNADENNHFVPRAIGMFGHDLNPDYFVNPPAFTYLLHALYTVKWGTDPATVGDAYARDPTTAFVIARAAAALLGAAAAVFTAIAGARLFGDRRKGILAGALLATAFLPVHYSHFALNDAPTLAPIGAALIGVAGIFRTGRTREYALAGVALGIAVATKYTAGILVLAVAGAALASPVAHARIRNLVLAAVLTAGGFLAANPYALLDAPAFKAGLQKQTETAGDEGGKLGLAPISGWRYYLEASTWGFGWLPSLAAVAGGAVLALRRRRLAVVLLPAPVLLFLYLGHQSRFFARWMLPVYPVLCLLAAHAVVAATGRLKPRLAKPALAAAAVLLCAQGLVFSAHNDLVLARADTRQIARDWMVEHIPAGTRIVVEPVFPDQWAADAGHPLFSATGSGNRWNKYPTSRSRIANDGSLLPPPGRVVKLEDYERTTFPALVRHYAERGFCWVVTGSTQFGRAFAEPKEVPRAIAYYAALRRAGEPVYRVRPYDAGARPVPFSFDYSFNYYPLRYGRPGPEIVIYRLRDCTP